MDNCVCNVHISTHVLDIYRRAISDVVSISIDFLGHFYKLLYEDFEVYIEQIVVRSERVVRAPRLSDNLLDANRKPKDHKSA